MMRAKEPRRNVLFVGLLVLKFPFNLKYLLYKSSNIIIEILLLCPNCSYETGTRKGNFIICLEALSAVSMESRRKQ